MMSMMKDFSTLKYHAARGKSLKCVMSFMEQLALNLQFDLLFGHSGSLSN